MVQISILRLLNHEHIAKLLDVVHDAPLSATFCRYCACTEYYPARLTGECRTCSTSAPTCCPPRLSLTEMQARTISGTTAAWRRSAP